MTVGVKSRLEHRQHHQKDEDDWHQNMMRFLRLKEERFDKFVLFRFGGKEDSLRKALHLAAHWVSCIELRATGLPNKGLQWFADDLQWQDKQEFMRLVGLIHRSYTESYMRGEVSETHLKFVYELFHCPEGQLVDKVFEIIEESRLYSE